MPCSLVLWPRHQILDEWPFKVLKNWGYTDQTFILEFDDRTYPVKTSQGRWMNALVDFHIEAILGDLVRTHHVLHCLGTGCSYGNNIRI